MTEAVPCHNTHSYYPIFFINAKNHKGKCGKKDFFEKP